MSHLFITHPTLGGNIELCPEPDSAGANTESDKILHVS